MSVYNSFHLFSRTGFGNVEKIEQSLLSQKSTSLNIIFVNALSVNIKERNYYENVIDINCAGLPEPLNFEIEYYTFSTKNHIDLITLHSDYSGTPILIYQFGIDLFIEGLKQLFKADLVSYVVEDYTEPYELYLSMKRMDKEANG